MRQNRLKRSTMLILGLVLTLGVQAQEAIHASGGNVSGSDGSVSYPVGQFKNR